MAGGVFWPRRILRIFSDFSGSEFFHLKSQKIENRNWPLALD
jgi:hypothetical protein